MINTTTPLSFNISSAPKITQFFYIAGMVSILIAILMVFYIFYLLFYPIKVFELNKPIELLTTQAAPGQPVEFLVDYCKFKDRYSEVNVDFVNGALVPSVGAIQHFPEGCHKLILTAIVPISTPTNHEYTIVMKKSHKINPLRTEAGLYESSNKVYISGKPVIQTEGADLAPREVE